MAKIKMDPNRMGDLSTKIRSIKSKTNDCQSAVGTVINNLDWKVSSQSSIDTRLKKVQKRLQAQSGLMDGYIGALATVSDSLSAKDRNIKNMAKELLYMLDQMKFMAAPIKPGEKVNLKTDEKLNKIYAVNGLFIDRKRDVDTSGKGIFVWLWEFLEEFFGRNGKKEYLNNFDKIDLGSKSRDELAALQSELEAKKNEFAKNATAIKEFDERIANVKRYQIVAEAKYWKDSETVEYGKTHETLNKNVVMDCSGFAQAIYKQLGIEIPRSCGAQQACGEEIPFSKGDYSNLRPGDLLLFDYEGDGKANHTAIYIGDGKIIHSLSSDYDVVETRISELKAVKGDTKNGDDYLMTVRRLIN